MESPPDSFQTERLELRKPVMEDAEVIFEAYARDPEVTRYLTWRPNRSVEETREFLRDCLAAWSERRSFHWVIVRRRDRRLMGMVTARVDKHKWELGYVLARPYWGRGYMTEAVKAVVAWAMAQPEIYRVWSVCDVDNPASARVMEKVGMKREGRLLRWSVHPNISPEPRDSYCYSIVK
ncbi:MAG TPA: GNAT family N-acetyltransferase [candidate division Zixibacteria bacterium]|nr:GNAT family N-acetyltransferase [candidate division Zixibacteria bacterium]